MTDIARQGQSTAALLAAYAQDFAAVLPSTGVNAATFIRRAQGQLRRDRALASAAQGNPGSYFAALLDCASLGHEPGSGAYHLVVFGGTVTGIEDYKGKIDRIYRAGQVSTIKAEIVYAADRFEFNPARDARPTHEIDWDASDRGQMRLAYAFAEMRDGSTSKVVVLNRAAIEKHRKESRGSDSAKSPWVKWPESMWLKTAVHELEKWIPSSSEYREEIARARASAEEVASSGHMTGVTPQALQAASERNDVYEEPAEAELVEAEAVAVDKRTGEVYAKFDSDSPADEEEPW